MKKFSLIGLLTTTTFFVFGQNADAIINAKEADRIERVLSSDDMRGRKTFSPEIDKAADFIADEFKKAGLQTFNGANGYKQDFAMVSPKFVSGSATFDNDQVDFKNVVVITCQPVFSINEKSGYEKVKIEAGKNFQSEVMKHVRSGKNYFVLVDTSYSKNFSRLTGLKRAMFKMDNSVVFALTTTDPKTFTVESRHDITEQKLANVVGILPGKSKKDEYVIFSGHYDHLGIGKPDNNGDSIYNGANDDAAGTTAVLMLAKYFKALGNNERTIVFAAFYC
jgi:Zn-dependent M28 family amino/carboxypeptidase